MRRRVAGSTTGRLLRRTELTRVKMAALAPMPRARVSRTVRVKEGVFLS